jgi:Na+/proline symporter
LLGGLAWFAIPFTLSTTLGLAAVALQYSSPSIKALTPAEVSAGLPAAAAASALLGKGGAVALLLLLFLAVTSAASAELIAVGSLGTYDVYKRYIRPNASDSDLLRMGHFMVAGFAIVMGLCGLIFYYIGVSMGWLYTFMGVILGSAVCPIALAITWSKANKWGCIAGSVIGFGAGITAWLVTTSKLNDGVINVVTSGGDYEMLAGNLASIGTGAIISILTSYIWPENFDFDITRQMGLPADEQGSAGFVAREKSSSPEIAGLDEKKGIEPVITLRASSDSARSVEEGTQMQDLDPLALNKAFRFAAWSSLTLLIILIILIPLPLFFTQTVFTERGLTAWVVIGIIWTFCSAMTVVVYPIWESRVAIREISGGLVRDMFGLGDRRKDVGTPA